MSNLSDHQIGALEQATEVHHNCPAPIGEVVIEAASGWELVIGVGELARELVRGAYAAVKREPGRTSRAEANRLGSP
jgi:hypothetical protein